MAWQGRSAFFSPTGAPPRSGGLPQTPCDLPAHIPEMALAMPSPARAQETRGKAKRRSLVTTFSHRLIPVVSVTRSPTAVLADLRRHSDTCTSASNTFTNTLQIIRDGPTLLTEHRASAAVDGVNPPSRHLGQFPGAPVPAFNNQHSTPSTQPQEQPSLTNLPMGPGTWAVSDPHQHNQLRRAGSSRLNLRSDPQRSGNLPRKRPNRSDYSVRPTRQEA